MDVVSGEINEVCGELLLLRRLVMGLSVCYSVDVSCVVDVGGGDGE